MKNPSLLPAAMINILALFTSFLVDGSAIADETSDANSIQNESKLVEILRPVPYFDNGQQVGYRLYPGTLSGSFDDLGLQSADLLTEINGRKMTDAKSAFPLLLELTSGKAYHLTLQRNDETINIDFQID